MDSGVIKLVISSEFAKKKKLDKLIYIRNMNITFNYKRPIKHIVEGKLFYRGYKERTEIDIVKLMKFGPKFLLIFFSF